MEIFHVHTYRCRHASDESDEQYIQKAIDIGAAAITFTDHSPFPYNPFGNRMMIEELSEYVETLRTLKERYKGIIEIRTGLEVEYLPSFGDYYKWLYESKQFEVLMLGQHFYEYEQGKYSFGLEKNKLQAEEYKGLAKAVIQGIETGYFNVLAHPDRMFRKCKEWTHEMETVSKDVINAAIDKNIVLEKNLSSMERSSQYWKQFWELVPGNAKLVTGIDAHSTRELEKIK